MDRTVTDDQRMLLDTSERFIESVAPLPRVRDKAFADASFAADYRRQAGQLGWFSMLVPEALGGGSVSGNGLVDAALIAYKRGAGLQPGAFVATNVVGYALAAAGSEDQRTKVLPGLIAAEDSAAWVMGASGVYPTGGVLARATSAGFVLSGSTSFVQDADTASWLLVTADAQDDGGAHQFVLSPDAAGVSVTAVDSLDLSRRFCEVAFVDAEVPTSTVLGDPGSARPLVERQLAVACVLTAAESVGAMNHDFEMALQYAKDRIAFGRPIGSFQAVKHLLADTSLALEMSKAITTAAAESLGADDGYGVEAASAAKAFVGESGVELAQNCFQIFGGIGFTWEHDQHLYLRRLTTDAALFGDPSWHRERLCQVSGL